MHLSVSASDDVLSWCANSALKRQCAPHASCPPRHILGSAPQVPLQRSLLSSPARSYRSCMAADSSLSPTDGTSEDDVFRLYRSLEWTTRTPPPLTVYLQPYLQDLLRRRSQATHEPSTTEDDSRRASRRSTPTAPSGYAPVTMERRAPRTPPGAAPSKDLTDAGRLPSRPRAPRKAPRKARVRSPPAAAPRRHSSSSSSRRSRTPATDPQRRLPIPRRRSGDDEDLNRDYAAAPKAETAAQGPDGMWYLRPKPKRYPLAPPRKDAYPADRKSETPGPRPKGSVREQLDQCSTRHHAASSDSKSPKQPALDALLACSSSTVPSEGPAGANSPGALIDAFFKTTDAAAQRVYTVCCASAPSGSHSSCAIQLAPCTRPALRLSPGQPPIRRIALGFTSVSANSCPVYALQVGSLSAPQRFPAQAQHTLQTPLFRWGPQHTTPSLTTGPFKCCLFSDRHVAQLVHTICHYANCRSHCQFHSRTRLFQLGLCSGPLLQPCHLRVTRPPRWTVIITMRPPPSSTRTRSWRPSTRQPVWLCCKVWPTDRPELHVVRCSVRQYRCHCMALSREHPEPPGLALRRHLFAVGAGPRESLINPIIHQLLKLQPPRALRRMPITLWRSEWTPPGQSISASRSASFQLRPHSTSATQAALSLPMTTAFAQHSWLKTFAMQQRPKRLYIAVSAQLQSCSSLSLPSPLYAPCLLPNCPWLRSPLLRPCGSCLRVRLSAKHWPKALVQLLQACMHDTCRRTQTTSLFSPLPQALYLEAPPPGLQLGSSQHASWRTPQAACLWTASRPTHRLIRLVPLPHLHLPITNWNKRLRKLNIERWRSCLVPPWRLRLRIARPQLPPPVRLTRRWLKPPCRYLLCRTADAIEVEAGHELLRITPWKRPQRRTSKSTYRSPSGASRGGRIHNSLSLPTDGPAPRHMFFTPLHPGASRSQAVPEECWPRFLKCFAAYLASTQQLKSSVHSTWVRCLPCDLRPQTSLAAALHAPSLPYPLSCTLLYHRLPASLCNTWSRRYPAQNSSSLGAAFRCRDKDGLSKRKKAREAKPSTGLSQPPVYQCLV